MIQKISACIVAFNEGQVIERCLMSLEGVVDEIILVHDGQCEDKTIEIANKYNANVYIIEHTGQIDLNKVYAIEHATYEWILQIDADEFLSQDARRVLRQLIQDTEIDAYAFRWPAYNGKCYVKGPFEKMNKTILLRKNKLYQIGITDEPLRTYGKLVLRLDILLEHKPLYNNYTLQKLKTKWYKFADSTAYSICHLGEVRSYNVPDPDHTPSFQLYRQYYKHPMLLVLRYVLLDFFKMLLIGKILFASLENWKILYMIYAKRIHTVTRIIYYKHTQLRK